MITVITGVPGAGKTLFAIQKLLLPMVGTSIKIDNDYGDQVEVPRTIFTNINGLLVDHELIQADTDQGLHNWHNWAKPGSVIVFDEFQRAWPPRPNGSKLPEDLSALDTHRHMGVDFILITQNVMNCDRHLHGLTGRHLHVRRMAGLPMCVVYEWDHCSRSLQFKNAMARKPWRYDRKIFKLYKSAKVHTKQPRSLPATLYVIPVVLGFLGWFGPGAYAKLTTPQLPPGVKSQAQHAPGTAGAAVASTSAPGAPASPLNDLAVKALAGGTKSEEPELSGCYVARNECRCLDAHGRPAKTSQELCRANLAPLVATLPGNLTAARPEPFLELAEPRGGSSIEDVALLRDVAALRLQKVRQ